MCLNLWCTVSFVNYVYSHISKNTYFTRESYEEKTANYLMELLQDVGQRESFNGQQATQKMAPCNKLTRQNETRHFCNNVGI